MGPSTARMFNVASKKLATKPIIAAASAEEAGEEDKYPGEDILNAIYGAATLPGVIGKGAVDTVSEAVGVSESTGSATFVGIQFLLFLVFVTGLGIKLSTRGF